MDSLNDFRPNDTESAAVSGFPEQVAIGYLRRSRRWMKGRRAYDDAVVFDVWENDRIFGSHDG